MTPAFFWRLDLMIALHVVVALWTAVHAVMNKHEPRAAWAWITACWLFPFFGPLLYFWFGINRIQRKARRRLGAATPREWQQEPMPDVPGRKLDVRELVRIGRSMAGSPLLAGNRVTPLHNGEQVYPEMLAAIAVARETVWLESYIFDAGEIATQFVDALAAAMQRGVQVRVLLDDVGDWSWRTRGSALLKARGIPVQTFLPLRFWPPALHINLRDHRKLMTVDGIVAFAGGMNISDIHLVERGGDDAMADLHFRFEGPIVRQFEDVFVDAWRFSAGEKLEPTPPPPRIGEAHCRVITDGPNDEIDRLQLLLLGVIANAHERISIMTPYFIPTPELTGALQAAALRGVEIEIILPKRSDQWWVDGATRRWLKQLLGTRLRAYYRPQPSAHSKLLLMDDYYALVGSANLDPRSLRLNFELMVEIYDPELVRAQRAHFDEVRARSEEVSVPALRRRPAVKRLVDSILWLFSPYL
jgi:cardiolipin synthase A/B